VHAASVFLLYLRMPISAKATCNLVVMSVLLYVCDYVGDSVILSVITIVSLKRLHEARDLTSNFLCTYAAWGPLQTTPSDPMTSNHPLRVTPRSQGIYACRTKINTPCPRTDSRPPDNLHCPGNICNNGLWAQAEAYPSDRRLPVDLHLVVIVIVIVNDFLCCRYGYCMMMPHTSPRPTAL